MLKKSLLCLTIIMSIFIVGNGIACEGPQCKTITNSDVEAGVYTDTMDNWNFSKNKNQEDYAQNYGWTGHAYEIEAKGTKSAYAHGEGQSDVYGFGGAFQKEINGGELSGSGALTVGVTSAEGHAKGVDAKDCNTGADKAKVDVEVFGYVAQANGAYSDDRDSFIGGGNTSEVEFSGQSDKSDYGSNDQWRYSHTEWKKSKKSPGKGWVYRGKGRWSKDVYRMIPDLTAEAHDNITGVGIAAGGTLVYAKQTDNSATVAGITAGTSTALMCGAENQNIRVSGNGAMGGVAQLPGNGYAAFSGDYNYEGSNFGIGVTGGVANVNKTNTGNHVGVSSSATSFSAAAVANPGRPQID